MKKIAAFLIVLMLVAPHLACAQEKEAEEAGDAPVKVHVLGLSKDRMGISYRVTIASHKPIRTVDLGVSAHSEEAYIGAVSLKWPAARQSVARGRTYDCTLKVLSKPLQASDKLTVRRGVLHVVFSDGSTWTSAGKYSGTGR